MARYYVNRDAQPNGDHEVHVEGCAWMPAPGNRQYLGDYETCFGAVLAAKKYFPQSNGCKHCSLACHTS